MEKRRTSKISALFRSPIRAENYLFALHFFGVE
jgi:hypothetical protein